MQTTLAIHTFFLGLGFAILLLGGLITAAVLRTFHLRMASAESSLAELRLTLKDLLRRVAILETAPASPAAAAAPEPTQEEVPAPVRASTPPPAWLPEIVERAPEPVQPEAEAAQPPAPAEPESAPEPPLEPEPTPEPPEPLPVAALAAEPAPTVRSEALPAQDEPEAPAAPGFSINWEQFLGVKLFAWLGGLLLFVGVAFFLKWSFDQGYISPTLRMIAGGITGAVLVGAGVWLSRRPYPTLARSLCGSGIIILYAVLFTAHAHYGLIGAPLTFTLMTAVTALAFGLAVWMDAQVIAGLGLVGGFLTPVLLDTGQDQPLALFGYIALLDLGLLAMVAVRRWSPFAALAAGATAVMQLAWFARFYQPEKIVTLACVFLGFQALFLASLAVARRFRAEDPWHAGAALIAGFMALGIQPILLGHLQGVPAFAPVAVLLTLATLGLLAVPWLYAPARPALPVAALLASCAAIAWFARFLASEIRHTAIGFFTGTHPADRTLGQAALLFVLVAALHLGNGLLAHRRRERTGWHTAAALLAAFALLLVQFAFLGVPGLPAVPLLVFALLAGAGLAVMAVAWLDGRVQWALPLASLAGAGVTLAWCGLNFTPGLAWTAAAVFLGYQLFHLAPLAAAWKWREASPWHALAAIIPGIAALGVQGYLLRWQAMADAPLPVFTVLVLASLGVIAAVWLHRPALPALPLTGALGFLVAAQWTLGVAADGPLGLALGFYLVYGLVHSAAALLLGRDSTFIARWWPQLVPLGLMLLVLAYFAASPVIGAGLVIVLLALYAIVIACAVLSLLVWPLVAAGVVALGAVGLAIERHAALALGDAALLLLLGGFAAVGLAAVAWVVRRVMAERDDNARDPEVLLPALLAAAMPYVLVMFFTARLQPANPGGVYLVALLLGAAQIGLARWLRLELLAFTAWVGAGLVQAVWTFGPQPLAQPATGIVWAVVFAALFLGQGFVRARGILPWAVAALAAVSQSGFVYVIVRNHWDFPVLGIIPLLFLVPWAFALRHLVRTLPANAPERSAVLAWMGGAVLYLVTVALAMQFERAWLTVGWALEGAALLWLLRRVPHPGLRGTGLALLAVAFLRLVINPGLDGVHPNLPPVFNHFLYTYAVTAAACFAGAVFLSAPWNRLGRANLRALLAAAGAVLLFWLLNIEIATAFSPDGRLRFEVSGTLAQSMAYSLGWSAFALGLLVAGIALRSPATRYASMALIGATLLKLFFHDLQLLEGLYRIGAFIGVALILIVSSFLYQKFVAPLTRRAVGGTDKES